MRCHHRWGIHFAGVVLVRGLVVSKVSTALKPDWVMSQRPAGRSPHALS